MTKISNHWTFHKAKQRIRSFVLPKKPIINGIWFPAEHWLDVVSAQDAGLLKQTKNIIGVERDFSVYKKMEENAPKNIPVKCFYGKIEKMKIENTIDYAFMDFLGGGVRSECLWMSKVLSPNLSEDATVAITQQEATRGSKIFAEQDTFLKSRYGDYIKSRYSPISNSKMLRRLMLLHRIFSNWDFDIVSNKKYEIPRYRDVLHYMLVFKLINFRKPDFCFPPLEFSDQSSEQLEQPLNCQ